jgi:Mce-associated membrane protein
LTLVGLAALGLLGTDGLSDLDQADATEKAARTAPAAAEAAAAAILAYDYKTLDADADTASRYMTEDFSKEYSDTFEKVVRPAAQQNQAKVTATVLGSATIRSTENTARVVLFVDQSTVSKANPRPQVALNRVEMSMVREGDSWLVAGISSF